MARSPFFRDGQPVRIAVSPTSSNTPFELTGLLPSVPDLTFMFVNNCPFDIRLEGTPRKTDGSMPSALVPVTGSTGWLILARSFMGPFTSKKPMMLSAMAVASPGMPLPVEGVDGFTYANCYLELLYGRGE